MIRVLIDRDSVAMGDDASPHTTFWDLPADTTVADMAVAAVDQRYLVRMTPEVTWVLTALHGASYRQLPTNVAGAPYINWGSGTAQPLALLSFPEDRAMFAMLVDARPGKLLRELVRPAPTGEYVIKMSYLPFGAAVPVDQLRRDQ